MCCFCVSTSERPLICLPPPIKIWTKWRPPRAPPFFVCRLHNVDAVPQTSKKGLSSECKLPRDQKVDFRNQKMLGVPVSDALNMVCRKPFRGEMSIICFAFYVFLLRNKNPFLRLQFSRLDFREPANVLYPFNKNMDKMGSVRHAFIFCLPSPQFGWGSANFQERIEFKMQTSAKAKGWFS